ncbi:MAG: LD-carboxypeptidase [Limnobacter sp.]|uniref:LD-carboxypeptidase n=1 Tax=Limnobacter sp. TaxID=2003368 RepID=UPI0022BE2346|nr:LD-carboxypeptidase [Limnobacter sp.]MCZ8015408.1 LD-carboxypeptidase [Limnobacter sp.]
MANALNQIVMFSPSGALMDEALLDRASAQLESLGFSVNELPQARLRVQRFAGDEAARSGGIEQAFSQLDPAVLLATRGGYGLSRLLPSLNFSQLAFQLNTQKHLLCGHSDVTSLQLALLQAGAQPDTLLHGPMACFDFGPEQGADPVSTEHFLRAVHEKQVKIQWAAEPLDSTGQQAGFQLQGPVWGGNLTLICSLLGTPWMPTVVGGILVLEDVNEPAYKIERMLLQLLHAGVLVQQKAVVLGNFCEPKPGPHDNGYTLKSAAEFVQQQLGASVPVLMNFPFGHCTPKACWFQGGEGRLQVNADMSAQLTQNLR